MTTYVKQVWTDNVTPVDAAHMSHIEDGILGVATSGSQPVTPDKYGGVGDGVTDNSVAFAALTAALVAGSVIDLNGKTWYTTIPLTITVDHVTLKNGKILGGANQTLIVTTGGDDFTAHDCTFQRDPGLGGQTTLDKLSNVAVNAKRFRSLNCNYTNAALACLYLANSTCEGARVVGGYWQNSSAYHNACFVYAAAGVTANERIHIEGIYGQGTGCPDGILLFDSSHCRVIGNVVRDLTQLVDFLWTSGWTLVSGSVYSHADRTDGQTRTLLDNGTQRTENTATPTNPGANQWGGAAGLVYLNLGGTDPNTHTITSRTPSGYAYVIYNTGKGAAMHENLFAFNEARTCDGMGLYFQMLSTDARNKALGNHYYDVNKTGLQDTALPFAAVSISRGVHTIVSGEHVFTAGYNGLWVSNGGTGISTGCHVEAATRDGFSISTSEWTCTGCVARANGRYGFSAVTAAGQTFTDLEFNGCRATANTSHGFAIDNTSGTSISAARIIGGESYSNTGRGIQVTTVTDCQIVGVTVRNNTASAQLTVGGTSTRVLVDGCNVSGPGGAIGISIAATCVSCLLGLNASTTSTPFSISATVQQVGSSLPTYVGVGTPEGVVTAPIGSQFKRSDGGAVTSFYVKESGVGNTGWVAK